MEESHAWVTIDRIPELRALFKGLRQTVDGKWAGVGELTDEELIRVHWVNSATLSDSEGTVIEAICEMRDKLPVQMYSGALSRPWDVCPIKFKFRSLHDPFFLLRFSRCC